MSGELSLDLLDMILSVMPDAAVVVDAGGTVVAANRQAGSLFGYDLSDLVGQSIEVLVPEPQRARHRAHRTGYMQAPVARSMGTSLHLSGRRADGSELPLDVSLAPIGGSSPGLVVAAVRDITERNVAAAARARLAALVETNQDGIVTLAGDGTVTTWNAGAARLFGMEEPAILGRRMSSLIPDEEAEAFESLLDAADHGEVAEAIDTRWRRADGRLLDVAVSLSALDPEVGQVSGYSLIVRDITGRKELERLLVHRERWLQALADIRLAIVSGAGLPELLRVTTSHLAGLLPGSAVLVPYDKSQPWSGLSSPKPAAADSGAQAVPAGVGVAADVLHLLLGSEHQRTGQLEDLLADLGASAPALVAALRGTVDGTDGPVVVVTAPVVGADGPAAGLLVVATGAALTPEDASGIGGLAEQLSLALRLEQSRQREQQLLLADDRARIARDLHDHVIQALFAAGMRLQSALPLMTDSRAAGWVSDTVGELDDTIGRIRSTIFSLEAPRDRAAGLRTAVLELARAAADQLGFDPDVRFSGPVETVPQPVRPQLLAVAREALSNAARHAAASRVGVDVRVAGGVVSVVVTDDGRGVGHPGRLSGLANARSRAEQLGGALTLGTGLAGGTVFDWHVPLEGADPGS